MSPTPRCAVRLAASPSTLSPLRCGRLLLRLIGLWLLSSVVWVLVHAADAIKKSFDLPADAVEKSLKRFSVQSGFEVLFSPDVVAGLRTQPVRGAMTPQQALDGMLAGTGLITFQDPKSGALTVRPQKNEPPKNQVPVKKNRFITKLAAIVASFAAVQSNGQAQSVTPPSPAAAAEEVIALNPFEVVAQEESYAAKDSIIATGFSQDLKRTPLVINIATDAFIRDAGLNSYADIAEYMPNTYVQPDPYGLGSVSFARGHQTSFYAQDGTRHYTEPFITTGQRVEVIKGPATLFFGRAQPGGIFNFSTPLPSARRRHRIDVTYGPYESTSVALEAQGKIDRKGLLTYRFDARWAEMDTFIDNGYDNQRFVRGVVAYAPYKWLDVRFGYEQSRRSTSGLARTPVKLNPQYFADYNSPRPEQIAWASTQKGNAGKTEEQLTTFLQGRWRESDANWAADTRLAFNTDLGPVREIGFDPSITAFGWDYNAALAGSYAIKDVWNWGPSVVLRPNKHIALKLSWTKYNLKRPRLEMKSEFDTLNGDGVFRGNPSVRIDRNNSTTIAASLLLNYDFLRAHHTTNIGIHRLKDLYSNTDGKLFALGAAPGVAKDTRKSGGGVVTPGWNPQTDPYLDISQYVSVDPDLIFPPTNTLGGRQWHENYEQGIFASHIVGLFDDKVALLAGGRWQYHERKDVPAKTEITPKDVYSVGFSWEVRPDIVLFASTNKAFEAQPFLQKLVTGPGATVEEQLNNPPPSKDGNGYDIGVKFGLLDRKLTGSVSWFETDRENDFRTKDVDRTNADPRNLDADPDNDVTWFDYGGRRLSRGIDFEAIWQPTQNYTAVFGWGWLAKAEITENSSLLKTFQPVAGGAKIQDPNAANFPGLQSPNSPRQKFSIWNRYKFQEGRAKGLMLGLGVSYTASTPLGNRQSDQRVVPEYYLVRTTISYPFKVYNRTLEAMIIVSNLFDEEYYRNNFRGEPRQVSLRAAYSF